MHCWYNLPSRFSWGNQSSYCQCTTKIYHLFICLIHNVIKYISDYVMMYSMVWAYIIFLSMLNFLREMWSAHVRLVRYIAVPLEAVLHVGFLPI